MAKQRHEPGQPMTLGTMRELGVHSLIAYCLNDACRHTALIDESAYGDDVEVPSFQRRAKCGKCGGKRVDVRPNWKERPDMPNGLRFDQIQYRRRTGLENMQQTVEELQPLLDESTSRKLKGC